MRKKPNVFLGYDVHINEIYAKALTCLAKNRRLENQTGRSQKPSAQQ